MSELQDNDLAEMQEYALKAFREYANTPAGKLLAINSFSRVVIARAELRKLESLGLPLPIYARTAQPEH